jgi:SAM-dependent methyltransferase
VSSELYGPDLAAIQHLGYGEFAASAAPGLLRLLHRAGIHDGKVVDLGCGAGVWLRELCRAGYEAVGVDASAALVKIARHTAPKAEIRRRSVYDFVIPTCDAVTALGEVLSYFPPGRATKPALAPLFRRVAAALRPGGLLVFDVMVAARTAPAAYRTWRAGNSWAVMVEVSENAARARLTREITTFRRVGRQWRRGQERHVLAIVQCAAIVTALEHAGFSVRTSTRYGNLDLAPGRLAFVAKRKRP